MNMSDCFRNMCRRTVNSILALLIGCGSVAVPMNVHAESESVNAVADNSEFMTVSVNISARDHTGKYYETYWGQEGVIKDTLSGNRMFCLEPGPLLQEGIHTAIGTLQSYFGKEKGDRIQLISYYGSQSGSATDYFAAQSLIWETGWNTTVEQKGSNGAAINAAKAVINARVNEYIASGKSVQGTSKVYRGTGQDIMSIGTVILDRDLRLTLCKHSSDLSVTADNSAYSLKGAVYKVYEGNSVTGKLITTMITDEDGYARQENLKVPSETTQVTFQEVQAPKGYALNSKPITVKISPQGGVRLDVYEAPKKQKISVDLTKKSGIPDLTSGNANYSLEGAEYEVFYQNAKGETVVLGKLTTDRDGKAHVEYKGIPLDVKELLLKEVTAPRGYVKDDGQYRMEIKDGHAEAEVTDQPLSSRVSLEIEKKSMEDLDNPAPLSGAQFTLSYYDCDPELKDVTGLSSARTWVIETRKDPVSEKYIACLSADYLVQGDPFYSDADGNPCLPLGILTIRETLPPSGYTLEHTLSALVNGNPETMAETDGTVLLPIFRNSSDAAAILTAQKFAYSDQSARGGLSLQKHDTDTGTEVQGNGRNLISVYRVINLNEFDVNMKVNGQTVSTAGNMQAFDYLIHTDEKGFYQSDLSFLQTGRYRLEEVQAPEGYVIGSDRADYVTVSDFEITEGQNTDMTSQIGDKVMRGGFTIRKTDAETTEHQGDTNLRTKLRLFNRSAHSVSVNGKICQPDAIIDVEGNGNGWFETDEKGWYGTGNDLLPYGSYEIQEVEAPSGYRHSEWDKVFFNITEDGKMAELAGEIRDEVVTGSLSIYKHIQKHESSQWDDLPEENAVFLAILNTRLNEIFGGDMKKAYETIQNSSADELHAMGLSDREYSIVVTGKDGIGTSGDLAYGSYSVRQMDGNPDTIINDEVMNFIVEGETEEKTDEWGVQVKIRENQKRLFYSATNVWKTYQIRMTKKDAATGKKVTRNGASFMIGYDSNENGIFDEEDRACNEKFSPFSRIENGMVVQTIGGQKYKVFRTASDNEKEHEKGTFVLDRTDLTEEIAGTVTTPVSVKKGKYFIFETDEDEKNVRETPAGYVTAGPSFVRAEAEKEMVPLSAESDSYALIYDDNSQSSYTEDLGYVEVDICNDRVLGRLKIRKEVVETNAEFNGWDHDMRCFSFVLYAKEDILDPADGAIITAKGQPARILVEGRYEEAGILHTDENGEILLENIPLGHYELQETDIPEEFATTGKTVDILFEQKENDRTETVIEKEITFENHLTEVEISKKAVTGEEELSGAELSLYDESNERIDHWISGGKSHLMAGLRRNHTYRLEEDLAPLGYVKASSICFTVTDSGAVQQVTMIDRIVEILKQDCSFRVVKGAHMQILKEEGEVADSWISDENPHRALNLEEGRTYVLHEEKAPVGYVRAHDIVFTVGTEGKNSLEVMIDMQITAEKKDSEGNSLEDAEMAVMDLDENVVDQWISDGKPHAISHLEEGKTYILKEIKVPTGYVKAEDIRFTAEGIKDIELIMTDTQTEVRKQDEKGRPVTGAHLSVKDSEGNILDEWTTEEGGHFVSGLEEGHTYVISEERDPALSGYYYAEDTEFTTDSKDRLITVTDSSIVYEIEKTDEEGRFVEGAHLRLYDRTDNTEVPLDHDGMTSSEPFVLDRVLKAGHTYELVEEKTAAGYHPASSVLFTVPYVSEGGRRVINMTDLQAKVSVFKTDENGNPVSGAQMEIQDTEGNTVFRFVTSERPQDLSAQLLGGSTYVLHEVEAPFGYEIMEDITFTVTGTADAPQQILAMDQAREFEAVVTKLSDQGKRLKGAEFVLENEDGETILDGNESPCNGTSDENGEVRWKLNYCPDVRYFVRETKAPEGYAGRTERTEVTLSKDFTFENPIEITIINSHVPVTADHTRHMSDIALLLMALCVATGVVIYRKNTEN